MTLISTVLEIVTPVFLLASIGFIWIKLGFEYRTRFVTQLTMTLGVPCLIFTALMQTEIAPSALVELSLATISVYVGITLASTLLIWLLSLNQRVYLAPITFGNTGNLGLPLALLAFGDTGLSYAVVIFAVMAIYAFTFGVWIIAGGGSPLQLVKEPMVGATVLGALFLWQDWETPQFLTNTLELIGQTAIPLMLITLGVAVARPSTGGIRYAVVLSFAKLILCFGVAWLLGRQFDLDDTAFAVLLLQVCTPVAVTSYLLAEKYNADPEKVAGLVVISTLLSIMALPAILALTI
ncbi:MAG: AEC family transporter [Aestuariivita sp.]|nr:AEC family transporter [Aestuariivita sp.]